MPYCQECGVEVDQHQETCHACGAVLRSGPGGQDQQSSDQPQQGQPPQGQPTQGQPPQGQQPHGQPAQGQPPRDQPPQGQPQQGQPAQGQPPQGQPQQGQHPQGQGQPAQQPPQQQGQPAQQPPQQQGQRAQQPPQGGAPPQQPRTGPGARRSGGIRRRKLLTYGGGLAALLGGGWLAYDTFLGSGGPVGTTKSFINALDAGNADKASDLLHSSSPIGTIPDYTIQQFKDYDVSIQGTEVVSESETTATVDVTLSIASPDSQTSQTTTQSLELRTEDGSWKIYTGDFF
jgi:hypothetical protein